MHSTTGIRKLVCIKLELSMLCYNSSNPFVTESFEERQLDKRNLIEKESLFTRHLGVDNSHVSLATDKDSKLQQLKALAYKSNLAKASSAQTKPNIGIVKLKRKHQKKPVDLENNSIGEGASDSSSNTVTKVGIKRNIKAFRRID